MPQPTYNTRRQTQKLRKGRFSQMGSSYFITFCTRDRLPTLATAETFNSSKEVEMRMQNDRDWTCHFLTVMPYHVHLLITLSSDLSLQQTIGKYKSLLKRKDRTRKVVWQDNFFDHRVRDPDDYESIAFYMFMNPYKKKLIDTNGTWNGHFIPDPTRFVFMSKCRKGGVPQEEWLSLELSNPAKNQSGRR